MRAAQHASRPLRRLRPLRQRTEGSTFPADALDELHAEVERGASTRSCSPCPTCRADCRASACTARSSSPRSVDHGAEACNYLFAVDVEMNTVGGYAKGSWEAGYGQLSMRPDMDTAAHAVAAGTALCLWTCTGSTAGRWSPRHARSCGVSSTAWPSAAGSANAGTELEFIVFRTPTSRPGPRLSG